MNEKKLPKTTEQYLQDQLLAIRPAAKLMGLFNPKIRNSFKEVEKQAAIVKKMLNDRDLFAHTFTPLGWVNYDRMSAPAMAGALDGTVEEGEALLTAHHLDANSLRFMSYMFLKPRYEPWQAIYERAIERIAAKDYLSTVPLLLIIIDGICTSKTGKHPFSGGADAPVFDTQTCGPGGIQEGFVVLGATRRRLSMDAITVPFRHGILHGLNPNFGYATVAAKTVNLLQATIDYFDRRQNEEERLAKATREQAPVEWSELARQLSSNAETRKALDSWKPRISVSNQLVASSEMPFTLLEGSAEGKAAEYMQLLVARNYGRLAQLTVDYPNRPIAYRAGRLRAELNELKVTNWTIVGIEDQTPALTRVLVDLKVKVGNAATSHSKWMRLMYADENFEAVVQGLPGGSWTVMPDLVTDLWLLGKRLDKPLGNTP